LAQKFYDILECGQKFAEQSFKNKDMNPKRRKIIKLTEIMKIIF
jgi:hypothetical protein